MVRRTVPPSSDPSGPARGDAARSPRPWRAADLEGSDEWVIDLAEDDLVDLERAVAASRHKDILAVEQADFPLPAFGERLSLLVDELEHGRGFAVLRGLPIGSRFGDEEATRIFWGIGRHLGNLVTQNRRGDLLGQIRDLGSTGPFERIYATTEAQTLHADSTDYAALLCLRQGLSGGDSFVASTLTLYDIVMAEHPEYRPILFKSFATDWRCEEPPGSPGWYLEPLFSECEGLLSGTLRTSRIIAAQRFAEVPRLTAEETACLAYLDSVMERPDLSLFMRLEPGDIQFVNNFITLHGRTAFVDDEGDPGRRRHLLRLWISRPMGGRPLCPEYAVWRNGYVR